MRDSIQNLLIFAFIIVLLGAIVLLKIQESKKMDLEKTARLIKFHEGFELEPYKCSENVWTWGYGRNLNNRWKAEHLAKLLRFGATQELAEDLFEDDLSDAIENLNKFIKVSELKTLTDAREAALIDMSYNLGSRLYQFQETKKLIEAEEWEAVANRLQKQRWYRQVKTRAPRIVEMLRSGDWPKDVVL